MSAPEEHTDMCDRIHDLLTQAQEQRRGVR